jgi:hypothetical protein
MHLNVDDRQFKLCGVTDKLDHSQGILYVDELFSQPKVQAVGK